MVAIEAAAHGLPTVAFAVGGVPDAVCDGMSGTLVPKNDYARFAKSVNGWLGRRVEPKLRRQVAEFAERFDWRHFGQQIRESLCALLNVDTDEEPG